MLSYRINISILIAAAIVSILMVEGRETNESLCECSGGIECICKRIKSLNDNIVSQEEQLTFWAQQKTFVTDIKNKWTEKIVSIFETEMKKYVPRCPCLSKDESPDSRPKDDMLDISAVITKQQEVINELSKNVSNLLTKIEKLENERVEIESTLQTEQNIRKQLEQEVKETRSSLISLGDQLRNVTVPVDAVMNQVQKVISSSIEGMNRTIYEEHLKKLYYKVDGVVYKTEIRTLDERIENVETEIRSGCNSSVVMKLLEDVKNLDENLRIINNSIRHDFKRELSDMCGDIHAAVTECTKTIEDTEEVTSIESTRKEEEISVDYPPGPEPTPIGKCALPVPPRRDISVKPGDGIRFGNAPNSRHEFMKPKSFMDSIIDDSTFALEFKTSHQGSGVLFYVSDEYQEGRIALLIHKGKIAYVSKCGTGNLVITAHKDYNDGIWHRAVFSRRGKNGSLVIDDGEPALDLCLRDSSINLKPPFYVGGLPLDEELEGINLSFPGCIRNVEAQGELLTISNPTHSEAISPCSDTVEEGTYFSSEGGYLVLKDKFVVGRKISISLDIKPRNISGILMAVHGRHDYLILQMVDGRIITSVDNGAGAIESAFLPQDSYYLCDGNWHTIHVIKSNNVLTASIDGIFADPGIGIGGVASLDTKDPVYIGGLPESSFTKKGVKTLDQFVGCMRNLEINTKPMSFAQSRVFGKVTLNTCPTI